MPDRAVALNIFRPNAAIEDPEVFAGRRQYLLDLTDALLVEGSVPVIYGERGLGKTSLALQIARIALGDVALLDEHGVRARALQEKDYYTVFWISCSDAATKNAADVLQRLINSAEVYSSLSELEERLTSVESKTKVTLKFFEREVSKKFDRSRAGRFSDLHIEEKVTATIEALHSAGHPRLLFIIDELDRVQSTEGLANFVKNASTANVKFLLVGIGQSISTLLADHESLARSLMPILVCPMKDQELDTIIRKAEQRMVGAGLGIHFLVGARKRMVEAAAGFPWFIHVLGQVALMGAVDGGRAQVAAFHIDDAISGLATDRLAQQLNDRYQQAVGDSRQREVVLRLLAKWPAQDVPVSEIYPLASELQVSNPAACRTQLLQERHGRVLVAPPNQTGVVRFRNAMFKRFCTLRSSIFAGVGDEVDATWSRRYPEST